MGRNPALLLVLFSLLVGLAVADWNILKQRGWSNGLNLKISLKNYCESWRINVELNNIREFDVVPDECVDYIGKYMTSSQYQVDSERALEQCTLYLSSSFAWAGDGKDAWIFDIDDTLLSTVPYYKQHHFGGDKLNLSSLEGWLKQCKAPALEHTLNLYNEIKGRGLKIFLISSRREHLREATVDNLLKVGYSGWTELILRVPEDGCQEVQKYKAEKRKQLIDKGYRIWGIVADQWSSLKGLPTAKRTFKLPNSLYYVA
ncbi:PREDICTED: acid phosphatase 1 [Nelumbo nucifera]|uniref:Acid phosphatase 1 n=1 Tax=Nelumbo nucifera TaxID=4432 RepID=A0A1U8ADB7_NELNU|nr:PREDICTED: acid phosphatase 1 [Nelumbo nucifera]